MCALCQRPSSAKVHRVLTVRAGGSISATSCASLLFGSRIRWKGTTDLGGIASRASAPMPMLACPMRSGGLSIVFRYAMDQPLCVVMLRRSWCVPVSYKCMSPDAVPTSRRLDVRESARERIG